MFIPGKFLLLEELDSVRFHPVNLGACPEVVECASF